MNGKWILTALIAASLVFVGCGSPQKEVAKNGEEGAQKGSLIEQMKDGSESKTPNQPESEEKKAVSKGDESSKDAKPEEPSKKRDSQSKAEEPKGTTFQIVRGEGDPEYAKAICGAWKRTDGEGEINFSVQGEFTSSNGPKGKNVFIKGAYQFDGVTMKLWTTGYQTDSTDPQLVQMVEKGNEQIKTNPKESQTIKPKWASKTAVQFGGPILIGKFAKAGS